MTEPLLRALSLGAGVQSTTLALMAAHGEVGPMPDCAIFSDTGWEPQAVYDHLRWLTSGNVLPFPVHIVSGGNLREDLLARSSARAGRFVTVPFFLRRTIAAGTTVPVYEAGGDGGLFDEDEEAEATIVGHRTLDQDEVRDGIGRRQCTSHYKVEPIQRKVRELLGKGLRDAIPAGAVEQWIGISQDEVIRATPSKVRYITKRFPLLERRMRRGDCLNWLDRHGYPKPPKSSCEGCPFHDQAQWAEIMADPVRRADVIEVDRAIRAKAYRDDPRGMLSEQFMHRQRVPIEDVDFAAPVAQGDLFLHECEGMCGV
jgi:hypothetical protein